LFSVELITVVLVVLFFQPLDQLAVRQSIL